MHYLDPHFLINTVGVVGIFFIIFAESGLFFGFFLPGDSLLFTAGLLASQHYLNIVLVLILAFLGAVLGDNVGYAFGKRYGDNIWKKENSFFFNIKYKEKTKSFYEKHGKKTIIIARFTPIVRTFAPIMAGVGKMDYKIFFYYNLAGGFLWTFLITLLGYFLGTAVPSVEKYSIILIIGIIIVSFIPAIYEVVSVKFTNKK